MGFDVIPAASDYEFRPTKALGALFRSNLSSLQFKASLLLVLLVISVTIASNVMSLRAISSVLHETEIHRMNDWVHSLAVSSARDVVARDREVLRRTAAHLVSLKFVAYVLFTDASGNVLASNESRWGMLDLVTDTDRAHMRLDPIHQPTIVRSKRSGSRLLDVVAPVYDEAPTESSAEDNSTIVGFMRLAVDLSSIRAELQNVWTYLLKRAAVVVFIVAPCSLLLMKNVVSPLNELTKTARAFTKGASWKRTEVSSSDEIGELAEAFNTMADHVASSRQELLRLNSELEKRVAQRTRELEDLASRDPLTGLYNRRHFSEVIRREFAAADRYQTDLTCLMFDLDHFKETNDRFGHRAGDAVLNLLADAIHGALRTSDVAARFGGDEFILLLPRTQGSSATGLAERITRAFNRALAMTFPGVPATLSVGVASLQSTGATTSEALIHEADVALYAAKQAGRNRTMEAAPSE